MILSFKNKELRRYFENGNSEKIKQDQLKRLRLILAKLHTATEIKDLDFPGSDLHTLLGDKKGFWSIRVNGNWRLIFRFEKGDIYDVDYVDYH